MVNGGCLSVGASLSLRKNRVAGGAEEEIWEGRELRRRLRQALTVAWVIGFLVLWLGQCLMNAVMDRVLYSGVWRPWPIRLAFGGMAVMALIGLARWIWFRLSGG